MGQIIWINGLAGAGKTTTAKALCTKLEELHAKGELKSKGVIYIDGDEFREVFASNGYTKANRIEIAQKRIALAIALAKQGFCVVNTAIALFNECYKYNHKLCDEASINYTEIFVKCDFSILEQRDQKGLYSKAKAGLQKDVVGIDIAYDNPKPNITINGAGNLEQNIKEILEFLGLSNDRR